MKIQILWMAVVTIAGGGLLPTALAWAQEKDEVPARATWRPQAPERPELPPGVERKDDGFKVERPKAALPGLNDDEGETERDAALDTAPTGAEVTSPETVQPVETEPEPEPEPEQAPAEEAAATAGDLEESRVESPDPPATVQASADPVERRPPSPIPGSVIQPEYPRDALMDGEEGYVTLEFTVTRDGEVSSVAITDASPKGVFEQAVRDAIRRWEFRPATENGQPVEQRVRHRFVFNLDE